jgi:hypothetical protein
MVEIDIASDWREFKERELAKRIAIPDGASVQWAKAGRHGMGHAIEVGFKLPDTKNPGQWLETIADRSAELFGEVSSAGDRDRRITQPTMGMIRLGAGSLAYEPSSQIYLYRWSDD